MIIPSGSLMKTVIIEIIIKDLLHVSEKDIVLKLSTKFWVIKSILRLIKTNKVLI